MENYKSKNQTLIEIITEFYELVDDLERHARIYRVVIESLKKELE